MKEHARLTHSIYLFPAITDLHDSKHQGVPWGFSCFKQFVKRKYVKVREVFPICKLGRETLRDKAPNEV